MNAHQPLSKRLLLAALLTFAIFGPASSAESFPTKPVRIIVPTPAGNGPDVIGRILADHLRQLWGQQVQIINQPGAAGAIAIRAAGTSLPDGYTLFLSVFSNFITLPEWQLPFDVARDFVSIGFVSEQPMLVATSPALGVNSLSELLALARMRPGEINVGVGSPRGFLPHLTAEWFRRSTGTDMTMVHYPGAAQAVTDLIGGRVHLTFEALSVFEGAVLNGSLKPLAVASDRRLSNMPELPTVAETVPDFVSMGWFALMAPPGTPSETARGIGEQLRVVLAQPRLKQRFLELGSYTRPMARTQLSDFIQSQQRLWHPVVSNVAATPK